MRALLYKIQNFFVNTPERTLLGEESIAKALFVFRFLLLYLFTITTGLLITITLDNSLLYTVIIMVSIALVTLCLSQLRFIANPSVAAITWLVVFFPKLFIHLYFEDDIDVYLSLLIWTLTPLMFSFLSLGWRAGLVVLGVLLVQNYYLIFIRLSELADGNFVNISIVDGSTTKSALLFLVFSGILLREYSSTIERLKKKIDDYSTNLSSLLEAIPDGCFMIINKSFEVLHAQGSYLNFFLGSTTFTKGQNILVILEQANKIELLRHIKLAMQGKRLNYELNFHQLWFEVYLVPIKNEKNQIEQVNIIAYNITQSKLSALKVEELSSYLESILDSTNDEIWAVDMNYLTTTCNKALRKILYESYGIDVVKNPNVIEQMMSRGFEQIAFQLQERYLKVFETAENHQYLDTYTSLKGPIHRALSYNPIFQDGLVKGVAIFSKDITDLLSIEEQLGQTNLNLQRALTLGKMGYFTISRSIEEVTLSKSFIENILAEQAFYTTEKSLSILSFIKEYFELKVVLKYLAEFKDFVKETAQSIENGEIDKPDLFVKTLNLRRKNGESIYFLVNVEPQLDRAGNFTGAVGVAIDITDITLTQIELEQAKYKAEEATKAKAAFLATMTHELRTPLNAVIGLTHLLQEQNPKPEQIDTLKTLEFSSQTLLGIINEILDYSKLEAGKVLSDLSDFQIKELMHLLVASFKYLADSKKIELLAEIDPRVPNQVIGDAGKIKQVLANLLSNAIKFTKFGRVMLSLQLLEERSGEVLLRFTVSDTGIGIPADLQQQIFEDFTQARADTYRKYGGTGLGLTITKKILETLDSKINLQSIEEVGSTFWFDLSFKLSHTLKEAENLNLIEGLGISSQNDTLMGKQVLLVEDNPINIMVAEKILKQWNLEVTVAKSGFKAIELSTIHTYDIVLMDLNMPELDGIATTERIRAVNPLYNNIPILVLTAAGSIELNMRLPGSGFNGVIVKPFQPNELRKKLKEVLEMKEQGVEFPQL